MDQTRKLALVNEVFSPSAPIKTRDLFLGRLLEITEVTNAIQERGQHVVLYGERGVGKTSLANIISDGLQGVLSAKVTCNRHQSFKEVWETALSKIRFEYTHDSIFLASEEGSPIQLNLFLPNNLDEVSSHDIGNILEKVDNYLLFIFDEFDSIVENETKTRFADTIKSLSDNATNVTILIVGIAENVTDLIGEHPSLERCLKQIKMPRMSNDELGSIIKKGLELLEIDIDENISHKIVHLSLGFPHFTHLLAKFSAVSAIKEGSNKIENRHFTDAIEGCMRNTSQTIQSSYQNATITSKEESKFEDVIGACAFATTDEYETFSANEVLAPYCRIIEKNASRESLTYYLSRLCTNDRGELLEKVGTSKNIRYRFRSPLMKAYARLKLSQRGKLDFETMELL